MHKKMEAVCLLLPTASKGVLKRVSGDQISKMISMKIPENLPNLQMQSIKPSSVPEYLKASAFFGNLSDDDQEVDVPKDCCKLDTTVTNAAELEELLRTVRFWGVDQIPETVMRFILFNERLVWGPVMTSYIMDLPIVAELVRVLDCERAQQVCEAVTLRNKDIAACLLEEGYPVEYQPVSDSNSTSIIRAVDIAAGNGDLGMLKVLRMHSCPFHENTGRLAALSGHSVCLEYLMQNGCPVAEDLLIYAFAGGSIECVKYVHEVLGCPWAKRLFRNLANLWGHAEADNCNSDEKEQKLLQCLEYAQAHGCSQDPDACYTCAQHGLPKLLQRLHEYGWPWDEYALTVAISNGHLDCLQYALEHDCPQPEDLMQEALLSGNVEIIEYLHDRGLPWPNNFLQELDFVDVIENKEVAEKVKVSLVCAYRLGCPREHDTCTYASKFGWYDILVDAHEQHGCELHAQCTLNAAVHGHLDCLVYLHEHGCPWDPATTIEALANKQFDCVKHAVEHGCPVSPDTLSSAIFSGSVEMVQYLHDKGVTWPDNILFGMRLRVFETDNDIVKAEVCLKFAYQLGCPRDPDTCYYASFYGWYDTLVDAHQHGCVWEESCSSQAALNGHINCLQYLHEHGCPWDAEIILNALRNLSYLDIDPWNAENFTEHGILKRVVRRDKYYECLIYAVEHGCPLPAKEDYQWWPADVELQQYLLSKGAVPPS